MRIELFPTFRKKKFKSFSWNIFIPCLSTSAKLKNLAEEELAPLYIFWPRRICWPFSTEASSAIFFLHRGATGRGALTGYIIFPGNTVIVYNHWFLMVVRLIVRVVWPSRCVTTCMTTHRDVRPPRCPTTAMSVPSERGRLACQAPAWKSLSLSARKRGHLF